MSVGVAVGLAHVTDSLNIFGLIILQLNNSQLAGIV